MPDDAVEIDAIPTTATTYADADYDVVHQGGVTKKITAANKAAGTAFTSRFRPLLAREFYPTAVTSAALAAAIAAADAAGGGIVMCGAGTYTFTSAGLDFGADDVTIQGVPGLTKFVNDGNFITVALSGNRVHLRDVWIDNADNTNACVQFGSLATGSVTGCILDRGAYGVAWGSVTLSQITIANNIFRGCTQALSGQGATGSNDGLFILDNEVVDCGTGMGIVSDPVTFMNRNVRIVGNHMHDWDGVLANPIEAWECHDIEISGNIIEGTAVRGIGVFGSNVRLLGNTVSDQTDYAFELGDIDGLILANNHVTRCASFANKTSAETTTDWEIYGNRVKDTGVATLVANTWHITCGPGPVNGLHIHDNIFHDWQNLSGVILVRGDNVNIHDNTFICSAATSPHAVVSCNIGDAITVHHNRVVVERNLAAGDDSTTALQVAIAGTATNVTLADNEIVYLGTVSSAPDATALGYRNVAANTCPGLRILRNSVIDGQIGVYSNATSTDMLIGGNDTGTCATANTVPYAAVSAEDRVVIQASAMIATSGPPVFGSVGGGRMPAWSYPNGGFYQTRMGFQVPIDWSLMDVHVHWCNEGAGAGDVLWATQGDEVPVGATLAADDAAYAESLLATAGVDDLLMRSVVATQLALTGSRSGQLAVYRNNSGGDSLANAAALLKVELIRVR